MPVMCFSAGGGEGQAHESVTSGGGEAPRAPGLNDSPGGCGTTPWRKIQRTCCCWAEEVFGVGLSKSTLRKPPSPDRSLAAAALTATRLAGRPVCRAKPLPAASFAGRPD